MGKSWLIISRILILGIVISFVLLNFRFSSPVFACSPPADGFPTYSAIDRANAADIVLEGTIIEVVDLTGSNYGFQTATVQVHQYLKGTGTQTVTISNFGQTSLCLTTVFVADHWIFYTKGNAQTGLDANYLTAHDAVDAVNSDILQQVTVATGPKIYLPVIILKEG